MFCHWLELKHNIFEVAVWYPSASKKLLFCCIANRKGIIFQIDPGNKIVIFQLHPRLWLYILVMLGLFFFFPFLRKRIISNQKSIKHKSTVTIFNLFRPTRSVNLRYITYKKLMLLVNKTFHLFLGSTPSKILTVFITFSTQKEMIDN